MQVVLIWLILAAVLALHVWVTLLVLRDGFSSKKQRIAQLFFVWLIPMVGAVLVMYFNRERLDSSNGKYREVPNPGDDHGYSGAYYRETKNVITGSPTGTATADD